MVTDRLCGSVTVVPFVVDLDRERPDDPGVSVPIGVLLVVQQGVVVGAVLACQVDDVLAQVAHDGGGGRVAIRVTPEERVHVPEGLPETGRAPRPGGGVLTERHERS
jgi:hypothetical protein